RALGAAVADGYRVVVEVSPHPVLASATQDVLDVLDVLDEHGPDENGPTAGVVVGTLRRGQGDLRSVLSGLARLYVHGVAADWAAVFAPWHPRRLELPPYAFQRRRYWPVPAAAAADAGFRATREAMGGVLAAAGLSPAGHPLLGAVLPSPEDGG